MPSQLSFERAYSPYPRSLAADRFRADSSTINSYFWIGHLADGGLRSAVKNLDAAAEPIAALSLPTTVYAGKMPHDVGGLRDRMKDYSKWRRLLTLVMISSALERYVDAAARIAIASDPLLEGGFPKTVDGAVLIKREMAFPPRDLSGLKIGDWGQRLAFYRGLFGSVPPQLEQHQGDLELLRKNRNKIAHALGSDDHFDTAGADELSILSIALAKRRPALVRTISISDERLVKLMAATQTVVEAIDQHLMADYIGGYELIAMLVDWSKDPDGFEARAGVSIRPGKRNARERFRNVVGDLFGTTRGSDYMTSLEQYVRAM